MHRSAGAAATLDRPAWLVQPAPLPPSRPRTQPSPPTHLGGCLEDVGSGGDELDAPTPLQPLRHHRRQLHSRIPAANHHHLWIANVLLHQAQAGSHLQQHQQRQGVQGTFPVCLSQAMWAPSGRQPSSPAASPLPQPQHSSSQPAGQPASRPADASPAPHPGMLRRAGRSPSPRGCQTCWSQPPETPPASHRARQRHPAASPHRRRCCRPPAARGRCGRGGASSGGVRGQPLLLPASLPALPAPESAAVLLSTRPARTCVACSGCTEATRPCRKVTG